jgi:hypothetical protein
MKVSYRRPTGPTSTVDEVGIAIIAHTPALRAASRTAAVAVASDARVKAAGTQEFVAPWGAVAADHIDLAAGILQGRRQVVEQVKQVRIKVMHFAGTMVAEIMVEFGQRFR